MKERHSGIRAEFFGRDRDECHPVIHPKKRRRIAVDPEEPERRTSYDLPSAGGRRRVDSRLPAPDADAPRVHPQTGCRAPWHRNVRRHPPEVRKPGTESEEIDDVLRRAVEPDDFIVGQTVVRGHLGQVGAELAAIADGNPDRARKRSWRAVAIEMFSNKTFDV